MEIIKYPEWIDECGEYIGALRQMSCYHMTINNPEYDRKHLNNSRNQLGLKGELIYALYLERRNQEYKMPRLWGNNPATQYDFQVKGIDIDVKTTELKKLQDGTEKRILAVNRKEHENKNKGIQWYAFIILTKKLTAELYYKSHGEVSSWGFQKYGFTDAYIKNL